MANSLILLRQVVYTRSKGYCEKCGKPLGSSWALHHRKLRSRGGKDSPENLLALHHECHNTGTNSVHLNPKMAQANGYMVSQWKEPTECPVTLPNGDSVILTEEGTYHYLERKANGW